MCSYSRGSPPADTTKKPVLKLRSARSIVRPAASTGNVIRSRTAVIITDQVKRLRFSSDIPLALMLKIVTIRLIEPSRDESPDRCSEKITRSTDEPE